MHLTKGSSCDFHFARKSVDWWVRLSDSCLAEFLHLDTIFVVEFCVLNSPDLVDSNAAMTESDGIVTESDEL